jgi:hypothetical protein
MPHNFDRRELLKLTAFGYASVRWLSGCSEDGTGVSITIDGDQRVIRANGLPDHPTGEFPNPHCPAGIRAQPYEFRMAASPTAGAASPIGFTMLGVALNGVPFDPAGPHFLGDDTNGWEFEVSAPNVSPFLGIDFEIAHTQPNGAYHYHAIAPDLIAPRVADDRMTQLGWAADGFPIYWQLAHEVADDPESPLVALRPSYRLRTGDRPLDGPSGSFDGTFTADYEYVAGLGELDEANGRFGVTPEFPDGTFYYVLVDSYPYIPRMFRGTPDASFTHQGTPGLKGLPPELRDYGKR